MDAIKAEIQGLASKLLGPVLVIGASGFVGANMLRCILDARDDVVGTYCTSAGWRLAGIAEKNIRQFDKTDAASVQSVLEIQPKTILDVSTFGAYYFET